jgi:amidohydrolase
MENSIDFRRHIHANPELSGFEKNTSEYVINVLKKLGITTIHQGFSMYSFIAEINGKEEGSTLLFRCELDALPIQEANDLPYRSIYEGISHKCGHDGHLAIMLRFAQKLMENPISKGKILLFFQSAEETGAGARGAIESGIFDQFSIDYAFALHNMPGFPMGAILAKEHQFTPCVESGIFELIGKTSHASEPHKGINPALAIAEIINYFENLIDADKSSESYFLCTPIHIDMGEESYGTSAGKANVGYTFRTWENDKFDTMKRQIEHNIVQIANKYSLGLVSNWVETFNANTNHPEAYQHIKKAASSLNMDIIDLEKPFEFGEDFGLFTKKYKGAMFGIGSGINQPPLHNAEFDFPDELIELGNLMFYQISYQLLKI